MMICRPTASVTVTFSGLREAPVPFTHRPQHPAHSRCLQEADGSGAGVTAEHLSSRDPGNPGVPGAGPEGLTRQERWGVESDLKARQTTERAGTLSPQGREPNTPQLGCRLSAKPEPPLRFGGGHAPHSPSRRTWEDPVTSQCPGGIQGVPNPQAPAEMLSPFCFLQTLRSEGII